MPLDPKLTKFTTSSPAIASYDFIDIDEGTGVVEYFLSKFEDNGGVTYFLTKNQVFTAGDSEGDRVIQLSGAGTLDVDFDVTFNIPKDIRGKAYLEIPYLSTSGDFFVRATLYHYDGSTETQLSQVITKTIVAAKSGVFLLELDVPNVIHFGEGEILRLRVRIDNTGALTTSLGIDPNNRTVTGMTETSTSKLYVPFVLNV